MAGSRFPQRARLISYVQGAGLRRDGLIADCVLPRLEVDSCFYEYPDWGETENQTGIYDNLRTIEDVVGCYTQAKRIDPDEFVYKSAKLDNHALEIPLTECCVSTCSPEGRRFLRLEQRKTRKLLDQMLLNREKEVIDKVTNESNYTSLAQATSQNSEIDTILKQAEYVAEGAFIDLSEAGAGSKSALRDENYDLLGLFKAIQRNNFKGGSFNKMVLPQEAMDLLALHPSLKDGGVIIPAVSTRQSIAAMLGVDEICIADTALNTAQTGAAASLKRIWGNYILFTRSYALSESTDTVRSFGFSPYMEGLGSYTYEEKGKGMKGIEILKAYHDISAHVSDWGSALLLKY